jgi:predicted nuclease of restriction endonuclease-like (RecB) superfamily
MDLADLVEQIRRIHDRLALHASRAVNIALTARNWLIGCHVHEYELNGEDRSQYGERVVDILAERLVRHGLANCNRRQLYRYLDFYRQYPQIVGTLSPQLRGMLPAPLGSANVGTPSPQSTELAVPPQKLIETLSYSHLELLAAIHDPLKRQFYEVECVRGLWTVRELKRQIASLAYERTGLSRDKATQVANDQAHAERDAAALAIRDPHVFEFLGLAPSDVMPERRLERALLDELEAFLLELGRGFCFEARQRRVLIGDEHFFVDLVFYHRILKCHVLIELKSDGFRHEYLGQLNAYVSWYREHETAAGDNPPVGILLCTEKNHALVKYALAGMESQLFVSKYRLALPDEAEMRKFIEARLKDGMRERAGESGRAAPSGRKQKPADGKGRAGSRKRRARKSGAARPRRKKRP